MITYVVMSLATVQNKHINASNNRKDTLRLSKNGIKALLKFDDDKLDARLAFQDEMQYNYEEIQEILQNGEW